MIVALSSRRAVRRRHRRSARSSAASSRASRLFWDRDILAFFLIGCIMFGLGLLGEYVGRIYQQVRDRPRYVIRAVLERDPDAAERRASRRRERAADPLTPPLNARRSERRRRRAGSRRRLRVSQRRRALPARAARARRRCAARRHARRRPERKHSGSSALRTSPAISDMPWIAPPDAERCRRRSHAFGPPGTGLPVQLLLPTHADAAAARAGATRRAQHARLAAAALSRPRAGQLGGAARRAPRRAPRCTT